MGWLAAVAALACGGDTRGGDETGSVTVDVTDANGIAARSASGAWLFSHDPMGWNDALLSGPADIVGECLRVGEYVVVWHVDRLSDAMSAAAHVREGQQPEIAVGGSGIGAGEDALPIPSIVRERCGDTPVWFGSPDVTVRPEP